MPALRSADGGRTWERIPVHVDQRSIAFDPVNPRRVWLGNDGGLFRSDDDGVTFSSFAEQLPVVQFYAVSAHPTDPSVLYGGTQDNGMERRIDGTTTWQEVFGGDAGVALFDRGDPSRILATGFGTIVVRLRDGDTRIEGVATGATFGESDFNARSSFIPAMAQGADGTVWFGTWRLFASHDFGTTWSAPAGTTDLTWGAKDTVTTIGIGESDPQTLYTGSAQGRVMVTRDAGMT